MLSDLIAIPDPDDVGSSEYRAVIDFLNDCFDSELDPDEQRDMLITCLETMQEVCADLLARLRS